MRQLLLLFKRDLHNLEYDPATQYRFNAFWAWVWLAQMPLVLVMIVAWPHAWKQISFFYLTEASLWANFANHFGAMSSALAAKHASAEPSRQELMSAITESDIIRPDTPQNIETVADDIQAGLLE